METVSTDETINPSDILRCVVKEGSLTPAEIATMCHSSNLEDIERIITSFLDLGVLRKSSSQDNRVRAPEPQASYGRALTAMTQRFTADAEMLGHVAAVLNEQSDGGSVSANCEVFVGHDEIVNRLAGTAARARSVLYSLLPRVPSPQALASALDEDTSELRRGVCMRAIYPESARDQPHVLDYARAMQPQGEEIRTHTFTPMRVSATDRGEVMVIDGTDPLTTTATLIRDPRIGDLFTAFLEDLWQRSTPLLDGDPALSQISPRELTIIRMLAQGRTDDDIGRRLTLAPRTIRRVIGDLHRRTSTGTRLELGIVAERRGWLEH